MLRRHTLYLWPCVSVNSDQIGSTRHSMQLLAGLQLSHTSGLCPWVRMWPTSYDHFEAWCVFAGSFCFPRL